MVTNVKDGDEIVVVAPMPNGDAAPMVSWNDIGRTKLGVLAQELAGRKNAGMAFHIQDFVRGETKVLTLKVKKKVSKKRGKAKRA